ncbi:MAG: hypothetical protein RLZZ324_584 [Candidatus Parcubacteria bacterium]|jgi:isopenicillin-N N-acyltransferase-like protein
MNGFVHVKTGGSHRDMGVDFGRAVKDVLKEFLAESAGFYRNHAHHEVDYLRRFVLKNYLPQAARRYPQYIEEVRGIAEGAKLSFEDVFLLTADDEISDLWDKPKKEKCSSAIVSTSRGMFMLHNEDYPPRYHGRLVICHAEPDDAPAFLALTYPYMLAGPSCGLNARGLGFTVDSMNFPPRREGTLSNFVQRDYYSSHEIGDVRRKSAMKDLTASTAVGVAHVSGEAHMLELSTRGNDQSELGASRFLAHTNHCLSPRIPRADELPRLGSRFRLAVLEHLLDGKAEDLSLPALKKSLTTKRLAVTRQIARDPHDSVTLASVVIDLSGKALHVSKRGPGGHPYRAYTL